MSQSLGMIPCMKPHPQSWCGQPHLLSSPLSDPWEKLHPNLLSPDFFCPCPLCLLLKVPVSRSNPQSLSFFSSLNPVMINCFSCFELSVERVPVLFPRMQHHQHFSIIQIGFRLSSCPSPWKELLTLALPLFPLTLM